MNRTEVIQAIAEEIAEEMLEHIEKLEPLTNGEVVKAVFPSFAVEVNSDWVACWINPHETIGFDLDWWNSPYQKGGE